MLPELKWFIDGVEVEFAKLPDPDIRAACKVTGLSEQSIIKISGFDKKSKESLNRLISFNRIEEILEFSERILFEK